MNGTIPPLLPAASGAQNDPLAIWSMILGIVSMMGCTFFTGLPGIICGHLALSRIKQSGGRLDGNGFAVAGLVTGYLGSTVFFIGMLAAIAIPNFVKARETALQNGCINNLRIIEVAKNQWALEKIIKQQPGHSQRKRFAVLF